VRSSSLIPLIDQAMDRHWLCLLTEEGELDRDANRQLANLTQIYLTELQTHPQPRLLLNHSQPLTFLAGLFAAGIADVPVFLGNPQWQETEWQQVAEIVRPNLVWGFSHPVLDTYQPPTVSNSALPTYGIMIPTGGSSGKLRFAIHTWETLRAAVEGFQAYMHVEQIHSCCVLPLHHVSGLMQALRSLWTGGRFVVTSTQALVSPQLPFSRQAFFLSLVPTQLQRLLQYPNHGLADWYTILLGGAPASADLLTQARQQQLPIALSYGMTETAAGIAILKPSQFLAGAEDSGQVLPHAQVTIQPGIDGVGQIVIQAKSLAQGYFGNTTPAVETSLSFTPAGLHTDDLGFLDAAGHLHVVGRSYQKIITGGENVFAPEVEAAILATGLVTDVVVLGLPHPEWGQVVTAIYVPHAVQTSSQEIAQHLQGRLSKFKHPKQWLEIERLPRNQVGKLNRAELEAWALQFTG
jgi:o-succinylbenzoate---CoA ligase